MTAARERERRAREASEYYEREQADAEPKRKRMSKKSGNAIVDAEQALQDAKHGYLLSHGWQYTSETPGCCWLWKKTTPKGETMLLDTDFAVSMQQHSCAIRGDDW